MDFNWSCEHKICPLRQLEKDFFKKQLKQDSQLVADLMTRGSVQQNTLE